MRKIIAAYHVEKTTTPKEPGYHILAIDYGDDEDDMLWYSEHPIRDGYQPVEIPSRIHARATPIPRRRP
jgi:hypothetical protein